MDSLSGVLSNVLWLQGRRALSGRWDQSMELSLIVEIRPMCQGCVCVVGDW